MMMNTLVFSFKNKNLHNFYSYSYNCLMRFNKKDINISYIGYALAMYNIYKIRYTILIMFCRFDVIYKHEIYITGIICM